MYLLERLALDHRWRHWHPVEKVVPAAGLLGLALLMPPRSGAPVILATTALVAFLGPRIPPGTWLRLLALPAGFLLLGGAALALSPGPSGGPPVVTTPEGLAMATEASLRALAATSALLLLAATTPLSDLLHLGRSVRIPGPLLELVAMVYRFVGLTAGGIVAVGRAQRARLGWSGWRRRVRSSGLLAASILPRLLDRGARMEVGLALRSMDGHLPVLPPADIVRPRVVAAGCLLVMGVAAAAVLVQALLPPGTP